MPFKKTISEHERSEMVRLYLSGLSAKESAGRFGHTAVSCLREVRERGHEIRTPWKRTYTLNESFFEKIDSPIKAYLLGFAATDGCISVGVGNATLRWMLARKDRPHLEAIAEAMGSDTPIRDGEHWTDGKLYLHSKVEFHSQKLICDLMRHGVTPRKSFTVKPCDLPEHLEPSWWLGVVDGDGFIRPDRGSGYFRLGVCGNLSMVQGFCDFVSRHTPVRRKPGKSGPIYAVHFCRLEDLQAIVRFLYRDSPLWLARKREVAEQILASSIDRGDWRWLTEVKLNELFLQHGSWNAVARSLGADQGAIVSVRKKLGMPMGKTGGPRKHVWPTAEKLLELYEQLGTWAAVGRTLGLMPQHLTKIKRKLGLL